jgi:hypothetical protein
MGFRYIKNENKAELKILQKRYLREIDILKGIAITMVILWNSIY